MGNIWGYARCSTNEQKQDIKRQTRELKEMGVPADNIYLEYESGTKVDRKQLNNLLDILEEGDTFITLEVSRISRSMKQLIEIIELAKDKRIKLIVGTFVVDFTKEEQDPMVLGMLQMMGVFAEMERNIISQRVKSGMANAKANGSKIGRPEVTKDSIPSVFYKHYATYKNGNMNITELARVTSLSRTTVYKYINIVEGRE